MPDEQLCGILNINKPSGMTSHDVVARVRKITGQRRVGHAGTLDPMATGVLLLCLGQATRVAEYLMAGDKAYVARVRLGIATDTYDAEGSVVSQKDTAGVTRDQVERALSGLVGSLEQTPPMYSAIKHKGTPLYRLARRGETVAREPRQVEIRTLKLLEWAPPELEMKILCSKGTYVRSIAHDLGQRLGCGAHVARLTRTACGDFRIEQTITLEHLEQAVSKEQLWALMEPLDAALRSFPAITVDQEVAKRIAFGQQVRLSEAPEARICRAYATGGQLLALLQHRADGLWQPHKVFVQPPSNENRP